MVTETMAAAAIVVATPLGRGWGERALHTTMMDRSDMMGDIVRTAYPHRSKSRTRCRSDSSRTRRVDLPWRTCECASLLKHLSPGLTQQSLWKQFSV